MESFIWVLIRHDEHRPRQVSHKVLLLSSIKRHFTFHFTPFPLDCVGVCRLVGGVYKVERVIDRKVFEAFILQTIIRFPTIGDDYSSWLNLLLYDGKKGLAVSLLHGHHEAGPRFTTHTTEHPLSIDDSSNIIFPLPKLTFIDLHNFSLATNLPVSLDAPLNQYFPAETSSVTNAVGSEAKFTLDEHVTEAFSYVRVDKYEDSFNV